MERTLVILKPETLTRKLCGMIISIYEHNGLVPVAMKMHQPTESLMKDHYSDLIGRLSEETIQAIVKRMCRSNCIFIIFQGNNVIKTVREINGATDPKKALPGTIRRYAESISENLVHGSDSVENAEREINIWFPELSRHQ